MVDTRLVILRDLLEAQEPPLLWLSEGVYEPDGTLLFVSEIPDSGGPDTCGVNLYLPEVYARLNYQSVVVFHNEVRCWRDPNPERSVDCVVDIPVTDTVPDRVPDLREIAMAGREALRAEREEE